MNSEPGFSFLKKIPQKNGVFYDTEIQNPSPAENLYAQVRSKEQRMLSDEEVNQLPSLRSHLHSKEWEKRARSAERILKYFESQHRGKILDLGCGNGWLTHLLSENGNHTVLGLDMNEKELEQAARLFSKPKVNFLYADLFSSILPDGYFDFVTVGAAIQYFPDLTRLLDRLFEITVPGGEIHLFDSPLYDVALVDDARRRSKQYYSDLGYPEMVNHYFHHIYNDLHRYTYKFLYKPATNRILKALSGARDIPFPWIRILNTSHEKE